MPEVLRELDARERAALDPEVEVLDHLARQWEELAASLQEVEQRQAAQLDRIGRLGDLFAGDDAVGASLDYRRGVLLRADDTKAAGGDDAEA